MPVVILRTSVNIILLTAYFWKNINFKALDDVLVLEWCGINHLMYVSLYSYVSRYMAHGKLHLDFSLITSANQW